MARSLQIFTARNPRQRERYIYSTYLMEQYEEDQHRGLGLGSIWLGDALIQDPKLAAGRGAAFSAGAGEEDVGPLEDSVPVHYYPVGQETSVASTSQALDASNKGFQLLQKLGWKGKGLGKNEDGIVEPVAAGVDAGVRLGLGKQAQDDEYTAAENITRKKLEVELQADEDPERRERREAQALKEQQIKEDVTQILKTFYCQVCNKQYQTAMELEEHLSSYDHHHKKRLAEARAAEMERTRGERQRKEQRRQQREQQRLEEQIRKAHAAAAASQQQQQQSVAPPAPPPPPPQQDHAPAAAGGWGWSSSPAAPPPPPPAAAAGTSGVSTGGGTSSSGGWSAQDPRPPPPPSSAQPPPPPPTVVGAAGGPSGAAAGGGGGMKFGLKAAGPGLVGRGAGRGGARGAWGASAGLQRPAATGRSGVAGRGTAAAARSNPAAMFGDSSSEDEGAA